MFYYYKNKKQTKKNYINRFGINNRKTKKIKVNNLFGGIFIKDWYAPFIECSNLNKLQQADQCFRDLKSSANNPFFLSDKINGFTNNGFFNGWGLKTPVNVKYIEVNNSIDISNAIKYGIRSNKKIIVKNTGHDYIGRSFPEDNMLVIFTHNMNKVLWKRDKYIIDDNGNKKQIRFDQKLKEEFNNEINYSKGYYTVDAGVQWWKVFDYLNKNKDIRNENRLDVWAMKGASNTVGAAGGWILDGGFSSFTKLFGMGVDNVLTMEVVLANGEIIHISKNNYPDLFFAFRGGGACNFGIVSNVTYKLLDPLTTCGDFFINIDLQNENYDLFKKVFVLLLNSNILLNKHFSGTIQIFKKKIDIYLNFANIEYENVKTLFVVPFINELNKIEIIINLLENTDISVYTGDIFFNNKEYNAILSLQPNSNLHKKNMKFTESHTRWWEYESFNDFIVAFGSRYLLFDDIINKEECAEKIWNILENTNLIQLETSKGLYGADDKILNINKTTAVNPKIRQAIGLLYIRSYLKDFNPIIDQPFDELLKVTFKYESNKLFEDKNEIITELQYKNDNIKSKQLKKYILSKAAISNERTTKAIQLLRQTLGNNSTYINHSDINEPNWGNTFWGEENFKKLIELKNKYDPTNVFQHKYSIPLQI